MLQGSPRGQRLGFTMVELLIVIAMISILGSIAAIAGRPSSAQVYALTIRSLVTQARFDAVRLNQAVVVSWDDGEQAFVSRVAGAGENWCVGLGTELGRTEAAAIDRISVTTFIAGSENSLVWIPSGQARSCLRSFFSRRIATVSDDRSTREVTVGTGGQVEVASP